MSESKKEPWQILVELEGLTINEAKLTYAERERLPDSAFCGPKRSFPAHDAAHVRNGLARLKQAKISPAVRTKIHSCLSARAKKYGIEIGEVTELSPIARWYLERNKSQ
jgi:hypothetical protein